MSELTADDIEQGFHNAMSAGDMPAAVAFMEALYAVDRGRGTRLYRMVTAAIELRSAAAS